MIRQISLFVIAFFLVFSAICESALARAGGRSSFSRGRSSTSYFNQGSRGSRTFQGGESNGKKYAPMQRSATQNSNQNSNQAGKAAQANPQNNQPNRATSFFQRNPMLSTFGAALAGSWLGHMLFGSSGFGAFGAGGSGGLFVNLIMMALGAFAIVSLVKFLTRPKNNPNYHDGATYFSGGFDDNMQANKSDFGQRPILDIILPDSEKARFSQLLLDVQNAWSSQNIDAIKKMVTPEMAKYFSDSLSQNISQGIANKVENIEVISLNIVESWREGDMEYSTALIEWSALDYVINLNKTPYDADYIVEGDNKNLTIVSEVWTFARFNSQSSWILSAIAQIE